MAHLISQSLLPGDIYFDIGANVGEKANLLAQRGVVVICVEPQPELAKFLIARFAGAPNVSIVQAALGRRAGVETMSISSSTNALSTFAPHWKQGRFTNYVWDQSAEVEMITLDHLVGDFGVPRYCKIDVEGYEQEVVAGLSRRVGVISFEFTNEFMDHALNVLSHLVTLGYRFFNLSVSEELTFRLDRWVGYSEFVQILQHARAQKDLWGDIYAN